MRKMLIVFFATCWFAVPLFPAQRNLTQLQALKIRQKQELREQKAQDKLAKHLLKNRNVPKTVRAHMKHQLRVQRRALRQKQKRERQAIKRQWRTMKKGAHL